MKNEKIAQESAATEAQVNKINYTSKTTNTDFATEVGNFTLLALANTKTKKDVVATLEAVGEAVKGFSDKKKVDLSLGNKVTSTMAPVGSTTNIPTTHAVIAKTLAFVSGATVEIVRNETKGQAFQITGAGFVAQFLSAILPYTLTSYDRLSRKFIDDLKDVTSVKREKRKEYTVDFAKAVAMALVRRVAETEALAESLESGLDAVAVFAEKPKKKSDKAPRKKAKSEPVEEATSEDPEGTVVYEEPKEQEAEEPAPTPAPEPEKETPAEEFDDFD